MDQQPGRHAVSPGLRQASDYAWRLLLLGVAAYVVFLVLLRFELVFVALFIALIITSLLRPPVNVLSRFLPRPLAPVSTALAGSRWSSGSVAWSATRWRASRATWAASSAAA